MPAHFRSQRKPGIHLNFISRYSQGDKGKRMMGNSKNNPQPNQIEEEKGKNRAHTQHQKGGRGPGEEQLSYYFPRQEIIANFTGTWESQVSSQWF